MAPSKRIFSLIFILTFILTSSAPENGNKILPYNIQLYYGHYTDGKFEAGEIRRTAEIDDIVFHERHNVTGSKRSTVKEEQIFTATNNAIITKVRIADPEYTAFTGGFVKLVNFGPDYRSVIMKFYTRKGRNLVKIIELFGHL